MNDTEPPPDFEGTEAHQALGTAASEIPTGTPSEIREATQELLRYGYVEQIRKPSVFRRVQTRHAEISNALEPLDLALKLDEHRGIAFLVVAETAYDGSPEGTEWSHPLVRRQRLTLEQSLLVAILRQAFIMHEQEVGVGGGSAKIAIEELLPQFLTYFEDSGSDEKNESRLSVLLDQLKTHGIVSEVDKHGQVTIRPLIAYIANPASLGALLRTLEEKSQAKQQPAP